MRNKTFTRLLAMALAVMCLVSSMVTAVGAAGNYANPEDLTDKTISAYKDTLDTISYTEYQQSSNFHGVAIADGDKTFDMTKNWVFENGNILVTYVEDDADHWQMTVFGKTYATR